MSQEARTPHAAPGASQAGYAMAALLVGLAIMGVVLSAAVPVWRTVAKREAEEELIFRGQQYARAIGLYQRKYANAFPPSLEVLLQQRFLRKQYRDPMTKDGEFQLLYQNVMPAGRGQPGRSGTGQGLQPSGPSAESRAPVTGALGQTAGPRGGIVGVASKSTEKSLRVYNGRTTYNEWQFVWTARSAAPGVPADESERGPARRGGGPGPGGRRPFGAGGGAGVQRLPGEPPG